MTQEQHQKLTLMQRLDAYEKLMRLDKPIGTLLLLWPALWGFVVCRADSAARGRVADFCAGHGADALCRVRDQ